MLLACSKLQVTKKRTKSKVSINRRMQSHCDGRLSACCELMINFTPTAELYARKQDLPKRKKHECRANVTGL